VIDTAAVALYTFSRNRNDLQPFLLFSPVVRRQLPADIWVFFLPFSDNSPRTSPESARVLDHAKQGKRVPSCTHLGLPLRLPRDRPDPQQPFIPRTRLPFGLNKSRTMALTGRLRSLRIAGVRPRSTPHTRNSVI
jgi:hypothetical protein